MSNGMRKLVAISAALAALSLGACSSSFGAAALAAARDGGDASLPERDLAAL